MLFAKSLLRMLLLADRLFSYMVKDFVDVMMLHLFV
jgi:hypothetical protein